MRFLLQLINYPDEEKQTLIDDDEIEFTPEEVIKIFDDDDDNSSLIYEYSRNLDPFDYSTDEAIVELNRYLLTDSDPLLSLDIFDNDGHWVGSETIPMQSLLKMIIMNDLDVTGPDKEDMDEMFGRYGKYYRENCDKFENMAKLRAAYENGEILSDLVYVYARKLEDIAADNFDACED